MQTPERMQFVFFRHILVSFIILLHTVLHYVTRISGQFSELWDRSIVCNMDLISGFFVNNSIPVVLRWHFHWALLASEPWKPCCHKWWRAQNYKHVANFLPSSDRRNYIVAIGDARKPCAISILQVSIGESFELYFRHVYFSFGSRVLVAQGLPHWLVI